MIALIGDPMVSFKTLGVFRFKDEAYLTDAVSSGKEIVADK